MRYEVRFTKSAERDLDAIYDHSMIYRVVGRQVFAILIVDSRRDVQSLLARRLPGA